MLVAVALVSACIQPGSRAGENESPTPVVIPDDCTDPPDAGPPDAGPPDAGVGCPIDFAPSEIMQGDVVVRVPLDLLVLRGKRAITGALTIRSDLSEVALPDLEYVAGTVRLEGASPRIDLPHLCHAGALSIYGSLDTLALDALRESGGIFISNSTLTSFRAAALTVLDGDFNLNTRLQMLSLPALTTIRGALILTSWTYEGMPLPDLTGLSTLSTVEEIVISHASGLVDLRGLEQVRRLPGGLFIETSDQLRSLDGLHLDAGSIGGIDLRENLDLEDLGALAPITSVVTTVDGAGNRRGSGAVLIYRNQALVSISFPNLTALTPPRTSDSALAITANDALTRIDFPRLADVRGNVYITEDRALPACQAEDLRSRVTLPPGATFVVGNLGTGTCSGSR